MWVDGDMTNPFEMLFQPPQLPEGEGGETPSPIPGAGIPMFEFDEVSGVTTHGDWIDIRLKNNYTFGVAIAIGEVTIKSPNISVYAGKVKADINLTSIPNIFSGVKHNVTISSVPSIPTPPSISFPKLNKPLANIGIFFTNIKNYIDSNMNVSSITVTGLTNADVNRMVDTIVNAYYADSNAKKIIDYLKKIPGVGSAIERAFKYMLRRIVQITGWMSASLVRTLGNKINQFIVSKLVPTKFRTLIDNMAKELQSDINAGFVNFSNDINSKILYPLNNKFRRDLSQFSSIIQTSMNNANTAVSLIHKDIDNINKSVKSMADNIRRDADKMINDINGNFNVAKTAIALIASDINTIISRMKHDIDNSFGQITSYVNDMFSIGSGKIVIPLRTEVSGNILKVYIPSNVSSVNIKYMVMGVTSGGIY